MLLFAALAISLAACGAGPESSQPAGQTPNVVVILADDQGWGDLSVHGNTNLSTPNIDSLARDGALFEHFYVSPVCSPTRAEFLTGRYAARGGVRGVSTGQERLNLDEHTIAQTFKAAGYATGAFGKWHNGTQHPYHPNARGFDEYYGFTEGHWGQYFDYELDHNGAMVQGEGFLIDDFTNHALTFIEANHEKPFFAYLPYNTPHAPMQVPDEYWDRFENKEIAMRNREPGREDVPFTRAALAMVENIDWNVGRVLQKLDELGLSENTIVLYFSDNGPNSWRWNDGMKGRKGSHDEGGVRAPLLIRWPGQIAAARRVPQIAAAIDLLPTLADLAGIQVQAEKSLDGTSLKPLLLGDSPGVFASGTVPNKNTEAAENESNVTAGTPAAGAQNEATGDRYWPNRTLFTVWRNRISARNQTYRLDPEGRLYNLETDPGQDRDVAAENPEAANELRVAAVRLADEIAAGWGPEATQALSEARNAKPNLNSTNSNNNGPDPQLALPYPPDDRPFPVGHVSMTLLPARDGVPHGGIERSNRAPNCSFFTNWTSRQDRITFDVEIAEAGDYEARIYYTVSEADAGATVELVFQGIDSQTQSGSTRQPAVRATAKITEAHNPPLYGAEDDRVPRPESYVKDFKPMVLGTLSLKKGRGELRLQATEIPGKSVADIRYVVLTKP
jgi:arylsulfatase A-like enzyme